MKALSKGRIQLAAAIRKSILPFASSLAVAAPFISADVLALPQGGQVLAGQAGISQLNNQTVIHQQSNQAVIQWNSFNINTNESVNFNQPSASSAILNRITDQNPSKILGNLTSNGQVFLINPNGIVFGKTARVNVAGIVASSLDITTKDFMAGKYTFTKNITSKSAEVINKGLIKASSSGVILIGSNVMNEGRIYAKLGNVALVSANKVSVDFDGDGLIQFQVDKNIIEKDLLVKRNVSNTGEIISEGGHVILNAQTSKEIFTQVVNNDGVIKASTIESHGGDVYLSGGNQSDIVNTGIIDVAGVDIENVAGNIILQGGNIKSSGFLIADASNKNGGNILLEATEKVQHSGTISTKGLGQLSKGGYVKVTGKNVSIQKKAFIDASGNNGGGEILLGGDFQGKGKIKTAGKTEINRDVQIKADANIDGDGGKVIVWSDKNTSFKGEISAKGGQNSGDGGFVEVSGKKKLKFEGTVDTSAEQGRSGLLLLDPEFISVAESNGASTLVNGSTAWDDDKISFDEALDESITISKKQLEDIDSNVILQATVGIEFEEFELNMQHDLTLETRNSISQSDHTSLPDKIHGIDVSKAAINVDNGNFIIKSGQNTDGDNDSSTTIKLGKVDAKNLEVSSANTIIIQDDIAADGDIVINSGMDATIVSSGIVLDNSVMDASVKLTSINGDALLNGQVNGQDKNGLVVDAKSGKVSIDEMTAINDLTIKSNSLSLDNNIVITGDIDFSAANGITLNSDTVLESTSGSIDLSPGLNGSSQTLQLNSLNEIDLGASQLKTLTVTTDKLKLKGDLATQGTVDLSDVTTTVINNDVHINSGNTILLGQIVEDASAQTHTLYLQGQSIHLQNIGQNDTALKQLNLAAQSVDISGNITTRDSLDFTSVTQANIIGTRELKSTEANIDFAQTQISGEQLTLSALNGDVSLGQVDLQSLNVYAQNARLYDDIDTRYSLDLNNATTIVLHNSLSLRSQFNEILLNTDIDGQDYDLSLDAGSIHLGDTRVNGLSVIRDNSLMTLNGDISSQSHILFADNSTMNLTQDTTLTSQGDLVLAEHTIGDVALTVASQGGQIDVNEADTNSLKLVNSGVSNLHGPITTSGNIDLSQASEINITSDLSLASTSGSIDLSPGLNGSSQTLQLNSLNEIDLGASQLKTLTVMADKLNMKGDLATQGTVDLSDVTTTVINNDVHINSGNHILLGQIVEDASAQTHTMDLQGQSIHLQNIGQNDTDLKQLNLAAQSVDISGNITTRDTLDFTSVTQANIIGTRELKSTEANIDFAQTQISGEQLTLSALNGDVSLGQVDLQSLNVYAQNARLYDDIDTRYLLDLNNATTILLHNSLSLRSQFNELLVNTDIDGQDYDLSLDANSIHLGDTRVNGLSVIRDNSLMTLTGDISSQSHILFADNSTLNLTQDTALTSQGDLVLAEHTKGSVALTLTNTGNEDSFIKLSNTNINSLKVNNNGVTQLNGNVYITGNADFSNSTAIHLTKNSQINSLKGDIYLASDLKGDAYELKLNAANIIKLGNSELGRLAARSDELDFDGDHILTKNGIDFSQVDLTRVAKNSVFKSTNGNIILGDVVFLNQSVDIDIQAENVELNKISDTNVIASTVKVQAENLVLNDDILSSGSIDFSNSNIYLNNSLLIKSTNSGDIDLNQTKLSGSQASLVLSANKGKITLGKIDGINSLELFNQGTTMLTGSVATLYDQDYSSTYQLEGEQIKLSSNYGNIFINNINSDSVNVMASNNIIIEGDIYSHSHAGSSVSIESQNNKVQLNGKSKIDSNQIKLKAKSDISIGHLNGENIELRSTHGSIIVQDGNGENIKGNTALLSAMNNIGSLLNSVNVNVNYLRIEAAQNAVINGQFKFQQIDGDTRITLPDLEFLASAKDYTLNMKDFVFIDRGLFIKDINLFSISDDAVFLNEESEDVYWSMEIISDDLTLN